MEQYPRSVVEVGNVTYFLTRDGGNKFLGISGTLPAGFEGTRREDGVLLCPLTAQNAQALRERLPWLRPQPLGLAKSVGCGDRIGLATPGHLRAVRAAGGILPIVAQQSMRENERTGRTVQEVMDDAMWGVFEEGWREPWGSDADHLKTPDHIDLGLSAGYTMFTVDPGEHVNNEAHDALLEALQGMIPALPWDALSDSLDDLRARYLGQEFKAEDLTLTFDELSLLRAACKYGGAIAHAARMCRHLESSAKGRPFEMEISVDETDTPTSPLEHYFVANELRRLDVKWVSLAPRYIGSFEKGVDYIGDLDAFEAEIARHAAIARTLGPYKLSLHSGSDKFSIYPIVARQVGELVHLKTAGTSYLEALRVVARVEPALFREILTLSRERFDEDKASYHVSAEKDKVPQSSDLSDNQLEEIIEQFDTRQLLHVAFGSVAGQFGQQLKAVLADQEEAHYAVLEVHFAKHLAPFGTHV